MADGPTKEVKFQASELITEPAKEEEARGNAAIVEEMKRRALKKMGPLAIEEIKRELDRHSFKSPPSKLKQSFEYEIKGTNKLIIRSDHPAATYLEEGVDDYQMDHLIKSSKPIPIMKDNGEVIFREATPQTMSDGKWWHPGIKGMHFIEKAVKRAKDKVKEEMGEEYRNFMEKQARKILDPDASRSIYERLDKIY